MPLQYRIICFKNTYIAWPCIILDILDALQTTQTAVYDMYMKKHMLFVDVYVQNMNADPHGGFCDGCELRSNLDDSEFPNHKSCANCSANYTLRAFGSDDPKDVEMRIYLAHRSQEEYNSDLEWISYNVGT